MSHLLVGIRVDDTREPITVGAAELPLDGPELLGDPGTLLVFIAALNAVHVEQAVPEYLDRGVIEPQLAE